MIQLGLWHDTVVFSSSFFGQLQILFSSFETSCLKYFPFGSLCLIVIVFFIGWMDELKLACSSWLLHVWEFFR